MKLHIVKRNPDLSDLGFFDNKKIIGYISQSAMGRKPIGWDAKIGDEIWLHEVGFGITKSGTIRNFSKEIVTIPSSDFNSLIKLFSSKLVKIKDHAYWWDLIEKMIKYPKKDLQYLEFEIEYNFLAEPIPCSFKFQGGWYTLKDSELELFEIDKKKSFLDFSLDHGDIESLKNIPTKIKVQIFNKMRLSNNDKLVIDFDHIIPKYVGGLGCFIENVQPLPKAVNRSKNKSVPIVLFDVAKEYDVLFNLSSSYELKSKSISDSFSQDKQTLNFAEKIMKITHSWPLIEQKEFYNKILKKYDFNYYNQLFN